MPSRHLACASISILCLATLPEATAQKSQHYTNEAVLTADYPHSPSTMFRVVRQALDSLNLIILEESAKQLSINALNRVDSNMVLLVRLTSEGEDSTILTARIFYRLFDLDVFRHLPFELASITNTVLRTKGLGVGRTLPQAVYPEGNADCSAIEAMHPTPYTNGDDVRLDSPPQIRGGVRSLTKNIKYPRKAKERAVEGRLYIRFLLSSTGDVVCAEVVTGLPEGLNQAAIRAVVKTKYHPARYQGEPVAMWLFLPITFRLR